MAKKVTPLSRAELLIMTALSGREHYGMELRETLKKLTDGRYVLTLGGLYTTLYRMEGKGLVRGRWGDATEERQGARRRYYQLTGLGERSLAETREVLEQAWKRAPRLGLAEG
jgi:DNA-binding PadR family transcriptional regulator